MKRTNKFAVFLVSGKLPSPCRPDRPVRHPASPAIETAFTTLRTDSLQKQQTQLATVNLDGNHSLGVGWKVEVVVRRRQGRSVETRYRKSCQERSFRAGKT